MDSLIANKLLFIMGYHNFLFNVYPMMSYHLLVKGMNKNCISGALRNLDPPKLNFTEIGGQRNSNELVEQNSSTDFILGFSFFLLIVQFASISAFEASNT